MRCATRSVQLSSLCARTFPVVRAGQELRTGASVAVSSKRNLKVQATTGTGRLKSMDELPGPSLATTLYWLFVKGYADKSHLLQGVQKRLYGPIWRSKFGPLDIINVASPELIAQVIQQEGPEWYRIRSVLNPRMLKMQEVVAYAPIIHQVVGDLLRRIEAVRSRSPDQATVPNLAAELYKFGFEVTASILFETRLGCLQEQIPRDTVRFIAAVNNMLTLSELVMLFPRWSRRILPHWKGFVQAWDDLCDVAQTLIDRRIAEIEAQVRSGEPAEGTYLTYLLSSDKLTKAEVHITATELLLGGVDTTSNTLSWTLYHLARDPEVQERLYREVSSVCPDRREPTTDDLSRMPYLKAVIKETLRLYPVVPGNGRLISESEVIVDNYWFPKKTLFHLCHYTVCHDEGEFMDAERFLPERWLRADAGDGGRRDSPGFYQHHPYSFIPFGIGVRACVGKRVAEMEMYFTLSRLLQHYEFQPEDGSPTVEPKTRILLIPGKPINLRFLPRA